MTLQGIISSSSIFRSVRSFPSVVTPIPTCKMENTTLPVVATAKCLGYWWGRDLFATTSIEENVKKARRASFSYGSMGAFQGDLNPLSSKSIIESCVVPKTVCICYVLYANATQHS